jgi:hypothetical protein
MMPTPFVLNDAVVIKQKIKLSAGKQVQFIKEALDPTSKKDSLTIVKDTVGIR